MTKATGIEFGVQPAFERVLEQLDTTGRAWVTGEVGSGRSTLAEQLVTHEVEQGRRATWVDLLELREADAIIGAVFTAAASLSPAAREACMTDWPRLAHAVSKLAQVGPEDFTVIVTVPTSWADTSARADSALADTILQRARDLLRSLVAASALRTVLITPRTLDPKHSGLDDVAPTYLSRPKNALALLQTVDWGSLAVAAASLAKAVADDAEPSPVALRLAVGAVGLGASPASVARELEQPGRAVVLRAMAHSFCERLVQAGRVDERRAVERQLLARRPVSSDRLAALCGLDDEQLPLLTQCVGYGERETRVSPNLRRTLLAELWPQMPEQARHEHHQALTEHYEKLDGADEITVTRNFETTAWLERMHHLAYVDPNAAVEHLPCRELYWTRGRVLSKQLQRYEEAADLYRACTTRFPNDSYAWHYLGYNLERAGMARREAEAAYEKAIEHDPSNPWWNSRRVTFLIGQGKPRAARKAWGAALDRVDPDGERSSRDGWLAKHFHRWVARAWLEAGHPDDAFDILKLLGDEQIDGSDLLRQLRHRVLDALEVDGLGGPAYPSWVPMSQRWKQPDSAVLPEELEGEPLRAWYPGRVIAATDNELTVFYGQRLEAAPLRSWVTRVDANVLVNAHPQPVDDFVFLAIYGPDTRCLFSQNWPRSLRSSVVESADLPLSYFDRWRSPA
ncbi:MAG: tetratricopeptide repeat protein [Myxococcota bacterium]